MAFDGDIGLKVRAVGLQQDIAKQARNAEKTLQRSPVKLGLDSKGFTQPLGRITGNMSEFQKSLDASTARVFAFGATVGVINGIAEGFKAVVASVIEVEKALADINVVMGLSIDRLQQFSEGLFEVARNTSQTFGTVATAATEFARQGLSAEETLKRVNDALILTRLSGLDAVKSVEALTAVVNGFAREGLNTTEIINRLANVDAAFAVSSKDLADALARSGATAQAAGVDFNELLAIVTSVQQQTARGGAVIGNAFKSIFTRLQRSKVRETLEGVGVATTDAFGNFKSAISILKDYAKVYDTLSDAQKAYTSEQIAGVFQVNNLKALVNDLNNEFSIYSQALSQAANTTDEATRRNEALNKTFAALGMQAGESLRELAQAFGEMSLEPAMMKVLQMLQTVIDSINSMLGEGDGDSMMSNFFKGMGNFIAGPGLALITAAFGKLFMVISKHALSAVKEMFKLSTEAQRQKGLQESILQILMSDETVYRRLIAATGDQTKQSQILLGVIRKINTEYASQQKLIATLAASPAMRGVAAGKGGFVGQTKAGQKKIGTAAEGLQPGETPGFAGGGMPEIQASIDAGYTNTVQPQQVRQMHVPNLGKVMYNTQERVVNVPNLAQPFIVPPASSKAYPNYVNNVTQQFGEPMAKNVLGRAFTPKQRAYAEGLSPVATAQRVTEGDRAASGLVPNYAPVPLSMVSVGDPGSALRSIKNRDIAAVLKRDNLNPQLADDGSNFNSNFTYEFKQGGKTIVGTGKELKAMLASQGGKAVMQQGSPLARAAQGKDTGGLHKLNANTSMLVPLPMGKTALPEKVVVSGDQLLQKVDPREIGALSREKSLKLPQVYGKTKRREAKPGEAALLIKEQLEMDTFEVGFKTSGIQEFEDDMTLRSAIDRDMKGALSDILERNAYKVLGKQSSTFKLNSTEIDARADNLVKQNTALTGLLFEDVISSAIQKSPVFTKAEQYRRWDFGAGDRPSLNEIFDQAVGDFSDAKRSPSPMAKISMGKKSLFATSQGQRILQGALNAAQGAMPTAATGLAPDAAYFSQVGKGLKAGKGRAKFFDVDDTLMDTSLAMKEMGIKPGDQRIYGDEKVAQNIARQAQPTLLGEKVKALKNKDNVFLLTDAGPERNQVLSEKFDIPLNKIIALRDPAQIARYGLDSAVPSAQGIRRQTGDSGYKLQEGTRDYRALKVREKKKKVIDKFRGMGVNPILYDDKLDIINEVGKHGKLMQFATPLAARGLVPNFSFYKNKGITDPTKVRHGIDPQGKGRGDFAGFQARTMARRGTLSKDSVFVNKGFGDKKTYYIKGQKVADAYKSSQAFQDGGFKLKAAEPPYLPKQLNYDWNQGTKMYRVEVPKGGQAPQVAAEGLVPNFAGLGGIHKRAFQDTNPHRRSTNPQNKSAGQKIVQQQEIRLVSGADISLAKNSGPFSKIKFDSDDISKVREKIGTGKTDQIHLNKPAFEKYADTLPLKTTDQYNLATRKVEDVSYVDYSSAKKNVLNGTAGELSKYFTAKAPAPVARRQFTARQQKEWDEQSERFKREAKQKKSGMYGHYADGLVPNLAESPARLLLSPKEEGEFQNWWKTDKSVNAWKVDLGNAQKSPDDPLEKFDYRKAWKSGDSPMVNPEDNRYHWGSTGKDKDHPTYHKQFTQSEKADWKSKLARRRLGNFSEGLVPNFIGRGNNKDISSRIYESVLGSELYGQSVSLDDTRTEQIEVGGKMQDVVVNNREKIFKTGTDVKRHFGLDRTPDGGMVLPPSASGIGRQVRAEAGEKMQNAAGGLVPNFAATDSLSLMQQEHGSDATLNMKQLKNALSKKGELGKLKKSGDISLKSTSKSVDKMSSSLKAFGITGDTIRLSDPRLRSWINLSNKNRQDFSSLSKAESAFRSVSQGAAFKTHKQREQEDIEKRSINIPFSSHLIGAGFSQQMPLKALTSSLKIGDQPYRVSLLGGGIKSAFSDNIPNWTELVANEFSIALKNLSAQFKLDAGFSKISPTRIPAAEFNKNIDQQMLPVLAGDAFDIAVRTIIKSGQKFDSKGSAAQLPAGYKRKKGTDSIDILGSVEGLDELLNLPPGLKGVELKRDPNADMIRDIGKKILASVPNLPGVATEVERDLNEDQTKVFRGQVKKGLRKKDIATAAQGFTPNFVDFSDKRFKLNELPNLPKGVKDAVAREKAMGVPADKIRVDFPSSQSMPRVAITNTRDEGNFASASQSVNRGMRQRLTSYRQANISGNPMLAGTDMEFAAGGIIPNYAITPKDVRQTGKSAGEISKAGKKKIAQIEAKVVEMKQQGKSAAEIDKYIRKETALEKNLFKEVKAPTKAAGTPGPAVAAKTVEKAVMNQLTKQSDFGSLETHTRKS